MTDLSHAASSTAFLTSSLSRTTGADKEQFTMIANKLKAMLLYAIRRYKFIKYRHLFKAPLSADELALFLPFICFAADKDVKVVYDIGAAERRFSTSSAKLFNIERVIAFEPLPTAFLKLEKNVSGLAKIGCYNVALGEANERVGFHVTADGDSSSCLEPNAVHSKNFPDRGFLKTIDVEQVRLDDLRRRLNLPYADLLKIDTQGFEAAVLNGSVDCLSKAKYCVIECSFSPLYENGVLIDEVWEFFVSRNWKMVGVGAQLCDRYGVPLQIDLVFSRGARSCLSKQ